MPDANVCGQGLLFLLQCPFSERHRMEVAERCLPHGLNNRERRRARRERGGQEREGTFVSDGLRLIDFSEKSGETLAGLA